MRCELLVSCGTRSHCSKMLVPLTDLFFLMPFLCRQWVCSSLSLMLQTGRALWYFSLSLCTPHWPPCPIILKWNFLNSYLFFLFLLLYPRASPFLDNWNHPPTPYYEPLYLQLFLGIATRELLGRHHTTCHLSIFHGSSFPHGQKSRFLMMPWNLPLSHEIIYQALSSSLPFLSYIQQNCMMQKILEVS